MARNERSRGRRRKTVGGGISKNQQGIVLSILALVILGSFITAYVTKSNEASNISHDAETAYCRKDILPESTVIVIDHTDSINPTQKASLERRLWDVASDVEKNGSIRFYSVDANEHKILNADFEMCNPGSEKDLNDWDGNKRLARKRYEKLFSGIVKEKMNGILSADTASRSPIMKSVQAAVVNSFIGSENRAVKKRLVLVSDLLEHSSDFSLYGNTPDFETFRKDNYWPSVRADMKDVEVTIFWLNRKGSEKFQKPQLKTFWQMYFIEQGASEVRFIPIEG
jgi:hypothetical protein